MNLRKLMEAEAAFLARFPEGFDDPDPIMQRIRKQHNVGQLVTFTRENLTELTLSQPQRFTEILAKIVSRSSMVSRFEKPPFRRFLDDLSSTDKGRLTSSFRKRLFGRQKREGFEEIVAQLAAHKLARWSLVSAVPFYFAPSKEAFVKPTTAKRILAYLDVDELDYHARPDWAFYKGYRRLILEIKRHVDPSLSPNNAAITGFLMSTM